LFKFENERRLRNKTIILLLPVVDTAVHFLDSPFGMRPASLFTG
jgi:hypothetical protein